MRMTNISFGIDIGGSAVKGAPVDIETGRLVQHRYKVPTQYLAPPADIARCVAQVLANFDWHEPFGCGFPAAIKYGVAQTAANVDSSWIGANVAHLLEDETGLPVSVLNDADAAGLAEMHFGAGRNAVGTTMMLTLGTGIGSAVFLNGELLPNTELGHLEMNGGDAERQAAASVKTKEDLTYEQWAARLTEYLQMVEALFWPDLIILGGGISRESDKFLELLDVRCEIVPAELDNQAGIAGAALAAHKMASAIQ